MPTCLLYPLNIPNLWCVWRIYIYILYFRTTGWLLFKLFFSFTPVSVTTRPSPSHVYFKHLFLTHTHCRAPLTSDQLVARPVPGTTQQVNTRDKHLCPWQDSNPRSQQAGGQDLRLRPHGYWTRINTIYNCLLKWRNVWVLISDAISDRCYNISLDHGVLRMRDFQAGLLKRLNNDRHHSSSD